MNCNEFAWRLNVFYKKAKFLLSNISRSNGNQTIKFGPLIEYNKRNIFLQKGGETSSRSFFGCWKCFIWGKNKCSAAYFQYISIAPNLAWDKNKMYNILDYWSWDTSNFDFLEKGRSRYSFSTSFCVSFL